MPEIKLALTPSGDGSEVWIDDQDIAASVRSIVVKAGNGYPTEVTFQLAAHPTVVEGIARLHLSAYTVKVLARFGWFAPEGATVNVDGSVLLADAPAVSE